jgi:hypothetical protein
MVKENTHLDPKDCADTHSLVTQFRRNYTVEESLMVDSAQFFECENSDIELSIKDYYYNQEESINSKNDLKHF